VKIRCCPSQIVRDVVAFHTASRGVPLTVDDHEGACRVSAAGIARAAVVRLRGVDGTEIERRDEKRSWLCGRERADRFVRVAAAGCDACNPARTRETVGLPLIREACAARGNLPKIDAGGHAADRADEDAACRIDADCGFDILRGQQGRIGRVDQVQVRGETVNR